MVAINTKFVFRFFKEVVWLTLTGMATFAILYPIFQKLDYSYYPVTAGFIFITLTYFRWTVTFRSLLFLHPAWVRFILFTINLSGFIFLLKTEQELLMRIDNFDILGMGFPKVTMYDSVKEELFRYIYGLTVFFGTGSLIMIAIFNTRIIVAWWQLYKRKANALLED